MLKRTCVLDTETTDLIRSSALPLDLQPRVYEYYGIVIGTGKEWPTMADWEDIAEIEELIYPGISIPKESTNITGINDAMVKDKPPMAAFMDGIIAQIESCDEVVAHNLSYDKAILDFEAARLDKTINWPKQLTCTVEATRHLKGHRLNLKALHEHLFGEGFQDAHRARNDVEALVRCYKKLVELGEL